MQPNPTKSAQIQSKPLKAIQIFPDPSKYVAMSKRIQRIIPNPAKINLYLSSKSTAILSSHPKSAQIQANRLKSTQINPNSSKPWKWKDPIRFNKPSSPNIPKSIRTHPNLPNRCNHVKYAQINKEYHRIYANQPELSQIQPRPPTSTQTKRNPTQSSNCNEIHSNTCRSTYTERIDHRITRLPAIANYTNNYRSRQRLI